MKLEEALFHYLTNHTNLKVLISDRVFPIVIPQDSQLPAITYARVSGSRQHTLQGDNGLVFPVLQVSCWAKTYASLKTVAEETRYALQNFHGIMGGQEGVTVQSIQLEGEVDGYEPQTQVYFLHYDFQIDYIEPYEKW